MKKVFCLVSIAVMLLVASTAIAGVSVSVGGSVVDDTFYRTNVERVNTIDLGIGVVYKSVYGNLSYGYDTSSYHSVEYRNDVGAKVCSDGNVCFDVKCEAEKVQGMDRVNTFSAKVILNL